MEPKEIQELIELISRSNFKTFELEREGFKLKLVKQAPAAVAARTGSVAPALPELPAPAQTAVVPASAEAEAAGLEGAATLGIAFATFGLVAGGLIGGPIAGRLIEARGLRGTEAAASGASAAGDPGHTPVDLEDRLGALPAIAPSAGPGAGAGMAPPVTAEPRAPPPRPARPATAWPGGGRRAPRATGTPGR